TLMNQKRVHGHLRASICATALICSMIMPVLAQSSAERQDLPARDQTYMRDLVSLSEIMGSAHALRVVCNGVDDQFWRSYMQQLLGLEAPNRSGLRSSMVDGFNRGYQSEQRRTRTCDSRTADSEAQYADRGRDISERLAAHYFPRRN
ncbi:MAG: TIGR02301 family protein, partial [Pseudomonadota bacterium]